MDSFRSVLCSSLCNLHQLFETTDRVRSSLASHPTFQEK
jgi:hypothetical protein